MITTPITPELVDGVARLEKVERGMRPHRLPSHVYQRDADFQLRLMEAQPSDSLHPDSETHRLIGTCFADLVFAPTGAFGGA